MDATGTEERAPVKTKNRNRSAEIVQGLDRDGCFIMAMPRAAMYLETRTVRDTLPKLSDRTIYRRNINAQQRPLETGLLHYVLNGQIRWTSLFVSLPKKASQLVPRGVLVFFVCSSHCAGSTPSIIHKHLNNRVRSYVEYEVVHRGC